MAASGDDAMERPIGTQVIPETLDPVRMSLEFSSRHPPKKSFVGSVVKS